MKIKVSIIIPSYNRYPLNCLTLYSLENQTFDPKEMEVILIDDGSTDHTPELQSYKAPYHFQYIRNGINAGRSKTRNIGIQAAKGDILIFLDAEVLTDPHFVDHHYQHHGSKEPIVVIGRNIHKVYSLLFPNYNKKQVHELSILAKDNPLLKKRIQQAIYPTKLQLATLSRDLKRINQLHPLLFPQDLQGAWNQIQSFSLPRKYAEKLNSLFGGNFQLPWLACTSMNHSVRKDFVESIGGFDENFYGWGLEDYEYGYRLYKAGAKFSLDPNLSVYHQEHPIQAGREKEKHRNLILFQQKHPSIDVCVLSLGCIGLYDDFQFMTNIVDEFHSAAQRYPSTFTQFRDAIILFLKTIPILKSEGEPITNLPKRLGISEQRMSQLISERDDLVSKGYLNLVRLFDRMIL